MASNRTCKCQRCLFINPAGCSISRSAYYRHRAGNSRALTEEQVYNRCYCPDHRYGHPFTSRSAYFEHLAVIGAADEDSMDVDSDDPSLSTGSPAGEDYFANIPIRLVEIFKVKY